MDNHELSYLIDRMKKGIATEEEIQKLELFWRQSENTETLMHDHTDEELARIGGDMFQQIQSRINVQGASTRGLWTHTHLYRAAAVILVMIAVSVWFYASSSSMTEITTDFGERRTVTLPDQSTVVLNGNSSLRYSSAWNNNAPREIWIEGEGFFSVTHQENDQKFIVHTEKIDVEVLGTKFNVRARENVSEVMLTEGKVRLASPVHPQSDEMLLKPGEVATVDGDGFSKRTAKREQFTSWLNNKLYFDRTTLGEVALMLKDTYGLDVRFEDPTLKLKELSGEISSATEDDILLAITETFNLRFRRDGRSVIISERPQ